MRPVLKSSCPFVWVGLVYLRYVLYLPLDGTVLLLTPLAVSVLLYPLSISLRVLFPLLSIYHSAYPILVSISSLSVPLFLLHWLSFGLITSSSAVRVVPSGLCLLSTLRATK